MLIVKKYEILPKSRRDGTISQQLSVHGVIPTGFCDSKELYITNASFGYN
jgi:hypothetical protein